MSDASYARLHPPPCPAASADSMGPPALDGEQALWAQFASATTAEAFCQSWLALQCRLLSGVRRGLVLWVPAPDRPLACVAVWPHATTDVTRLRETGQRAVRARRGLLLPESTDGPTTPPSAASYHVAYPLEIAGRVHSVVVLEVAARPRAQLQTALRQLYWGTAWLEVLFYRRESAQTNERASATRGAPILVFDTIAGTQHPRTAPSAAAIPPPASAAAGRPAPSGKLHIDWHGTCHNDGHTGPPGERT